MKGRKYEPPPDDATPFEKFQAIARHVANVPKAETDKLEAEYQRERAEIRKKRRRKKSTAPS